MMRYFPTATLFTLAVGDEITVIKEWLSEAAQVFWTQLCQDFECIASQHGKLDDIFYYGISTNVNC